jgi:hypothetical protein
VRATLATTAELEFPKAVQHRRTIDRRTNPEENLDEEKAELLAVLE